MLVCSKREEEREGHSVHAQMWHSQTKCYSSRPSPPCLSPFHPPSRASPAASQNGHDGGLAHTLQPKTAHYQEVRLLHEALPPKRAVRREGGGGVQTEGSEEGGGTKWSMAVRCYMETICSSSHDNTAERPTLSKPHPHQCHVRSSSTTHQEPSPHGWTRVSGWRGSPPCD